MEGSKIILIPCGISELNRRLRELNVVLPTEYCDGGTVDCIKVREVEVKLDPDKLHSRTTALIGGTVLNWKEDHVVCSGDLFVDRTALRIVPSDYNEVIEVCPILCEPPLPVGKAGFRCEHEIEALREC